MAQSNANVDAIRLPKMDDHESSSYSTPFREQGLGRVMYLFHSNHPSAEFVHPFRPLDQPILEEEGPGPKIMNELKPLCTSIAAFLHVQFLTSLFIRFAGNRKFCGQVFTRVVALFAPVDSSDAKEQSLAHYRILAAYSTFKREKGDPPGFHSLQKGVRHIPGYGRP